mmetsp:Transcript_4256/g.15627  ORF Transcript_4256/g.15627 Transcript_4256/m.15627 type:complete len:303 (-) Transcript_4256:571-1479(-)
MQGGGYVPSSGEQPHSVGYAVASGISEQPQGQNKFVEPRLRFERDIGRRRILEILRAVANDGRIFEHGQQGKAWQEHVEQLNQQEIFQIGGKGALKVGTAKEKFLEGLRAWKEETRRRIEAGEAAPPESEMEMLWRRCATSEAFHQSQDPSRSRSNRDAVTRRAQLNSGLIDPANSSSVLSMRTSAIALQISRGRFRQALDARAVPVRCRVQVLPFAEEASRKRSASVALDDFYLTPGLFDREEARSIAERKLAAEEKRAIAQEIRARAELMTSQAKMMERMLEARQQGIPVPEDFLARLMQ